MSSEHTGRKAIVAAFLANLGIAIAKFVGFVVTGAASMLAEAIHSVADTANQGLLLLGRSRAQRPATADHPFGFSRERYFWAFVVALILFTGGSLFALVEGIEKLRHPHELESVGWAVGILVIALVLEGLSLRTAVSEARPATQGRSWWTFIRRSKTPELPVVLLEDTGALLGLVFALAGVALAHFTGNPRFDAMGSVAIGVLLGFIAITLAVETKSMLIGEAADPDEVAMICEVIGSSPHVDAITDLRTEHLGPERILVVGSIALSSTTTDAGAAIAEIEERLRERVSSVLLCYLEPAPAASPA